MVENIIFCTENQLQKKTSPRLVVLQLPAGFVRTDGLVRGVGSGPCVGRQDAELLVAMRGRRGDAKCCGKKEACRGGHKRGVWEPRLGLDAASLCGWDL